MTKVKNKPKIDLEQGHNDAFGLRPDMNRISMFKVADISPGKHQPRTKFSEAELKSLAESIKSHGLIQPVILEPDPDNAKKYKVVAGERRWRAHKLLGEKEIEGILKKNIESAEIALIENVQREDLSPLEEALAYKNLMSLRGYSQQEVGDVVGKKRTTINEILKITELPGDILEQLVDYPNVPKSSLILVAKERNDQKQRSLWARARAGLSVADTKLVRKGKAATSDLSPTERVVRSMGGAVTKLEKLDTLDALSVAELKKLQRRIATALKDKSN